MIFEMQKKAKKDKTKPTQAFLKFSEIRDEVLVMQDGTLRAFLAVSSTNFDLKSQEEQDALIASYQRFLNSLDFPVQILMQSRQVHITQYLAKLKELMNKQTNELIRVQTAEYIDFISRLIQNANVMNKSFYCIVPYSQSTLPSAPGFFGRIFGKGRAKEIKDKLENLKKQKVHLDERTNAVSSSLSSVGLKNFRLNSAEIIELLYAAYNFDSGPEIDAKQLKDITVVEGGK